MKWANRPDGWQMPTRLVEIKKYQNLAVSNGDFLRRIWYFGQKYYCTVLTTVKPHSSEFSRSIKHEKAQEKRARKYQIQIRAKLKFMAKSLMERIARPSAK